MAGRWQPWTPGQQHKEMSSGVGSLASAIELRLPHFLSRHQWPDPLRERGSSEASGSLTDTDLRFWMTHPLNALTPSSASFWICAFQVAEL